jgi:TetR/AcrR family transcriptional regulator of autoinduction and epiphytic fitness
LSDADFLDKVLDIFLEHGFENANIQAITTSLGMAKRTFYLRYGSKEGLIEAVLNRVGELTIVPEERLRQAERDDLEESLLAIADLLVANIMTPAWSRLLRLIHVGPNRARQIADHTVLPGWMRTVAYLADLFSRHLGQELEEIPEATDLAEAFLVLVLGSPSNASSWGVRQDRAFIERRTRFNVRLLIHGLPRHYRSGAGSA